MSRTKLSLAGNNLSTSSPRKVLSKQIQESREFVLQCSRWIIQEGRVDPGLPDNDSQDNRPWCWPLLIRPQLGWRRESPIDTWDDRECHSTPTVATGSEMNGQLGRRGVALRADWEDPTLDILHNIFNRQWVYSWRCADWDDAEWDEQRTGITLSEMYRWLRWQGVSLNADCVGADCTNLWMTQQFIILNFLIKYVISSPLTS